MSDSGTGTTLRGDNTVPVAAATPSGSLFSFIKAGDTVTVALSLAGFTTREEKTVLSNRKGVISLDNGSGNDPSTFDHDGYHLVGRDRDPAMRLEKPHA